MSIQLEQASGERPGCHWSRRMRRSRLRCNRCSSSRASLSEAATSAADLLRSPSARLSRHQRPRSERLKLRAARGAVVGLFDRRPQCRHPPASESDVVHDHVRLRKYETIAVVCPGVGIDVRHMEHADTSTCQELPVALVMELLEDDATRFLKVEKSKLDAELKEHAEDGGRWTGISHRLQQGLEVDSTVESLRLVKPEAKR